MDRKVTVSCKDLGGDCAFVAEGADATEAKSEMLAHMRRVHAERTGRMSRDERDALDVRIGQVMRRR